MAASFSWPTQAPVSPGSREPGAGQPWFARRGDPEGCRGPDQDLLEVADVAVDVAAVGVQVEYRVTDELTRTVKGDVPAAAGLDHFDAVALELFRRRDDV